MPLKAQTEERGRTDLPSGAPFDLRGPLYVEIHRIDALHEAEAHRINDAIDAERRRVNEQFILRAEYDVKLAVAEAKRIDAIRAVDVAAVAVANERATAQASVLATQVSQSAETLRALVAATATTTAQQLSQLTSQLTDRLSSLEKSQYENKGNSGGMRDMGGWILAAVLAFVSIAGFLFAILKR